MHKVNPKLLLIFILLFSSFPVYAQSNTIINYSMRDGLSTSFVHDAVQDNKGRMWFAHDLGVSSYDGNKFVNYGGQPGIARTEYYFVSVGIDDRIWSASLHTKFPVIYFNGKKWTALSLPPIPKLEESSNTGLNNITDNGIAVTALATSNGLWFYNGSNWQDVSARFPAIGREINSIKYFDGVLYISTPHGIFRYANGKLDESLNKLIPSERKYVQCSEINRNDKNQIWLLGKNWLGEIKNNKFTVIKGGNNFTEAKYRVKHNYVTFDNNQTLYYGNEYLRYEYNLVTKKTHLLGIEDGFSTSGVSNVYIDRESNIWFTNFRGIDKLGGRIFSNFYKKDGLFEDEVSAIIEISKDVFLFGHNNGMTFVNKNSYSRVNMTELLSFNKFSGRIMEFCRDKENNIWVAASFLGVGKISGKKILWAESTDLQQANSIICDKDGVIWVGTTEGVYKVMNNKLVKAHIENEKIDLVRKLYAFKNGDIYCSNYTGLSVIRNNKMIYIEGADYTRTRGVFAVHDYENDTKLVASANGIFLLEKDSLMEFKDGPFYSGKKFYAITKDKQNNYWFGSSEGLLKWNGKGSRWYSTGNGLSGNDINRGALIVDSNDKLWIGTNSGMSRYNPEYEYQEVPPSVSIYPFEDFYGNKYDASAGFELPYSSNNITASFSPITFIDEKSIQYRTRLLGYETNWVEHKDTDPLKYFNLKPGNYVFEIEARRQNGEWGKAVTSGTITIGRPFYFQIWFIHLSLTLLFIIVYYIMIIVPKLKYSKQLEKDVKARTEDLQKANDKLNSVKIVANVGYLDWDFQTKLVDCSEEASKILGIGTTAQKVEQKVVMYLLVEKDRYAIDKRFFAYVKKHNSFDVIVSIKKPDSGLAWLRAAGIIYTDGNGVVQKMFVTILDITQIENAKHQLRLYSKELKKANSAKDRLFSIVAHDLKGPFQGLLGLSQIMVSDFDIMNPNDVKGYSQVINKTLQRQFSLVSNLLNWSKLQMGGIKLSGQQINLNSEIDFTLYLMKEFVGGRDIQLVNNVPPSVMVYADSQMLGLAVRNIFVNILKGKESGFAISADSDSDDVNDYITISENSGGNNGEIASAVFNTETGSGFHEYGDESETLGLLVSKDIIRKHGGTISFEKKDGFGIIKIVLPKYDSIVS